MKGKDLVSATEIAERHDVSVGLVHKWRQRHADFPQPIATLAIGPIWDWVEIEQWLIDTGRK